MTEAQRLADQLTRYFVKNTGVFLSFADATDGLTAAQAVLVPQEKFNSVWRVVNHVCYWIEAAELVIQGSDKKPETPGADTGGWHSVENPDDTAWQILRARTITLNTQLADVMGALNDEQLITHDNCPMEANSLRHRAIDVGAQRLSHLRNHHTAPYARLMGESLMASAVC